MIISQIEEILYYPSLRCNLNCKHCGEDQNVPQSEEADGLFILEKIEESILVNKDAPIVVTGGEPFLNKTLPDFILQGLKKANRLIDITSNGFLFDDIKRTVDQVRDSDREKLRFHISIDGLKQTHNAIRRNPNSFDFALKTAVYLAERGLLSSINTVIQKDNLQELDNINRFFNDISPEMVCSMGPLGIDCAEDRDYEYSKEYQEKSWRHLRSALDKKSVLAKGHYRIRQCHAGTKNIVIGPDGKVYSCLTGAFYRGKDARKDYCLGDLKATSLDQILTDMKRRMDVCQKIFSCKGCSDNYTMALENRLFGLDIGLSDDEVLLALGLEKMTSENPNLILGGLLDTSGWCEIEKDADRCWCWSNRLVSKVFVPITGKHKNILISYSKMVESQKVKVFIDGEDACLQLCNDGQNVLIEIPDVIDRFFITVMFIVDKLYSPSEIYESLDSRKLGICLTKIQTIETDNV